MESMNLILTNITKRIAQNCIKSNGCIKRNQAKKIIIYSRFNEEDIKLIFNELEKKGFIEVINKKTIKINKDKLEGVDWF